MLTLRVGSHKSAGSTDPHPMRGFIDELYVYDRALSDNEAKSLYEEKATELYKVDLNVLITEAEKLLSSGSLPEENELHVKLQEAISAAKEADIRRNSSDGDVKICKRYSNKGNGKL